MLAVVHPCGFTFFLLLELLQLHTTLGFSNLTLCHHQYLKPDKLLWHGLLNTTKTYDGDGLWLQKLSKWTSSLYFFFSLSSFRVLRLPSSPIPQQAASAAGLHICLVFENKFKQKDLKTHKWQKLSSCMASRLYIIEEHLQKAEDRSAQWCLLPPSPHAV